MLYFLSMRKKAQIDKQMFFDFYGVSLLSNQYLEANPYAKQYKDMIVNEIKDVYVPLITEMCYSELEKHTAQVHKWRSWEAEFDIRKVKDLSLEQLVRVYNEGSWTIAYGGKPWGHITESLIQLKNTTDTNQLITIIDHINDIEHNTGLMFHDFPKVEEWFFDALEIKAQASPEGLIPYLSTDLQKLVTEDLKLKGQEVVAPERYISAVEKIELAESPNTPPETLAELAKDEDEEIQLAVAENSNTPPETLAELAKDEDDNVRMNVAYNSSTSPETLIELAKDGNEWVRWNVIGNSNTPPEIKEQLEQTASLSMRKKAQIDKQMFFDFYGVSLLSNQYLEANPYAKQYKDTVVQEVKDVYVPLITKMCYSELSKHIDRLYDAEEWQEKFDSKTPKDLSLEQIAQIYNEGDWNQDFGGAAWGSIVESLIQLKNTTDTNQLITIIDHINDIEHNTGLMFHDFPKLQWFSDALEIKAQSTPEELIPYLSTDLQKLVTEDLKLRGQEVVAPERYISVAERRYFAYNSSNSKMLTELAKDEDWRVREGVADNPDTPSEILAELAKDEDEDIRSNVARNPNTPPEIKEQLEKQLYSNFNLNMRKEAYIVYDDKGRKFEVSS